VYVVIIKIKKKKINEEKELCITRLVQRNQSNELNITEEKDNLKKLKEDLKNFHSVKFEELINEIKTSLNELRKCEKQLSIGILDNKEVKFIEVKKNFGAEFFGKIDIKRISTWSLKRTLTGHSDWVISLAVLQNGDLASGSGDKTIKIWDSSTWSLKRTLTGHSD